MLASWSLVEHKQLVLELLAAVLAKVLVREQPFAFAYILPSWALDMFV